MGECRIDGIIPLRLHVANGGGDKDTDLAISELHLAYARRSIRDAGITWRSTITNGGSCAVCSCAEWKIAVA